MKKLTTTVACALAFTALTMAGTATAAPSGSESAADVVANLQAQGYAVQLNGIVDAPLSECRVTGIHGVPNPGSGFTTVYVDVVGPSAS